MRWYVGKLRHSETYKTPKEADAFALGKATELNNENRPPTESVLTELRRKAILWDEAASILAPHNWPVIRAVDTFNHLLGEMGDEGVRYFSHLYSPRLAKVRPCLVSDAVTKYQEFISTRDEVSKSHQANQKPCFEQFKKQFGQRNIHLVDCAEMDAWLEGRKMMPSTFSSWLYNLRGLFRYAKDYLKALPQTMPTECELIRRRKGDKAPAEVFTIREIVAIGTHLPDQETMLAFTLVLFGHLRQEEAEELLGQDFRRDRDGNVSQIDANNRIVKRKTGEFRPRTIEVKPNLKRILNQLLPAKGPLFTSNKVFKRIRRIAAALGIRWKHNALRHGCASYAIALGEEEKEVARLNGHTIDVLRKNYFVAVAQEDARKYWRITFNLERLKRLPRSHRSDLEASKETRAKRKAKAESGKQMSIFDLTPTDLEAAA